MQSFTCSISFKSNRSLPNTFMKKNAIHRNQKSFYLILFKKLKFCIMLIRCSSHCQQAYVFQQQNCRHGRIIMIDGTLRTSYTFILKPLSPLQCGISCRDLIPKAICQFDINEIEFRLSNSSSVASKQTSAYTKLLNQIIRLDKQYCIISYNAFNDFGLWKIIFYPCNTSSSTSQTMLQCRQLLQANSELREPSCMNFENITNKYI